ncbi:hypothetical protein C8Q77DRAFT_1082008 [Trametes polyzona]|nr:hypothetical protein C8Q77DRAFT_1082008 [Trametes polyzona]
MPLPPTVVRCSKDRTRCLAPGAVGVEQSRARGIGKDHSMTAQRIGSDTNGFEEDAECSLAISRRV